MKSLLNKLVYIFLPAIMLTSVFITSCTTDNLIVPSPPESVPDTASYYNWQKFESNADMGTVYVNDTNNVWIATALGPVIFNGVGFEYIHPINNFFMEWMDIIDKNHSFWVGFFSTSTTTNYPALIKYTNGSQELFVIDSSLGDGNHSGFNVLALNENQAWVSINPSEYVYFFNNGQITKHHVGFHYNPQFKKWNNSIYCFGLIYKDTLITTFKFNGTTFDSLWSNPLKGNQGVTEYIYNCGNDLISLNNRYGTYYFTDNGWQPHTVFPANGFYGAWKAGGVSKDSLSFFSSYPYDMYNWNGSRFRKQNNFQGFIGYGSLFSYYSNIVNYKGSLYFTVNIQEGISSYSCLVIGKPKMYFHG